MAAGKTMKLLLALALGLGAGMAAFAAAGRVNADKAGSSAVPSQGGGAAGGNQSGGPEDDDVPNGTAVEPGVTEEPEENDERGRDLEVPVVRTTASGDESESPVLFRNSNSSGADTPSGRLLLRMPARDDSGSNSTPPSEVGEPPREPDDNGDYRDEDDPPTYFGEPLGANNIFVIDVSESMLCRDVGGGEDPDGNVMTSMSRLEAVQYETVRMLRCLSESNWFDFVLQAGAEPWVYGPNWSGNISPITDTWRGELVQATPANVQAATDFILSIVPWGGTPIYQALQRGCLEYPDEMDTFIYLSDGGPWPTFFQDGTDHGQAVLSNFPTWYAGKRAYGCKLACFSVGLNGVPGSNNAMTRLLENLAGQNGWTYRHLGP